MARAGSRGRVALGDRVMGLCLLIVAYALVAAAAYGGYYEKWQLRESYPRFDAGAMLDGTAARPFVYRQLIPTFANETARAMSPTLRARVTAVLVQPRADAPGQTKMHMRAGTASDPAYALRYYLMFLAGYAALFAALFAMRGLCRQAGLSAAGATVAPILFALALPVLMTKGGYLYDFPEILFCFAFLVAALAGPRWRWACLPIALLGAFNKESFLFFILATAPLVIRHRRDLAGLIVWLLSLAGSGGVYLAIKTRYAANAGGSVENHLADNLAFYANPLRLLELEVSYAVPLFAGYSIISVGAVAMIAWLARGRIARPLLLHILLAALINVPLLLLFAFPGEMRNLSLLYPALVLAIAAAFDRLTGAPARGR
jgi:hypothetical protein